MFQDRIQEKYESLTPGFRKIADYIIMHTLDAAFLTTTELAQRVGVDQATVVRFAQALDYSGYRELSREIKDYVRSKVTASYDKADAAESDVELIRVLTDNVKRNLDQAISTEAEKIAEAAQILESAHHIWGAAEYLIFPLIEYFTGSLRAFHVPATAVNPTLCSTVDALARMAPDDVLMGLTLRFPHVDTGHLVKMANERGLQTIVITDFGTGLAAREADLTITVSTKSPVGMVSIGPAFNVLLLTAATLLSNRAEDTAHAFTEFNENLGKILKLRAETFDNKTASYYLSEEP